MTLLRGYADDMALEPWLQTRIWPFEAHLTGDDVYWGTMLAICEMLRGGTTCFADMYFFYHEGVRAMLESGIRACPGGVLLGFLPEPEKRIANAIAFAREYSGAGDGRIKPTLAPHSLYTCNREQWEAMIKGARDNDLLMTTHASETRREVRRCHGAMGAEARFSQLNRSAPWTARCWRRTAYTWMNTIWKFMQSSDFRVAHNPTSNMKLASGFAPIEKFLQAGITVGLGPDGTASNNNLDMWEEMHLAALLHKGTTGDPTTVSAQQALLMATREGARCLNLHHQVGTLQVGKKADIVLVDFDKPHLTPRHNVVSHLVYVANRADVDTVLVDGRVLIRGGAWTQLDAKAIASQASKCAARLASLA
jgi:5-methylthioadenosine/S-adenosylhomocysteine deaminase